MGLVYHLAFFARINPLAYVFGALSLAGAGVFVWLGMVRRELDFNLRREARSAIGLVLVAFALVIYPTWSTFAGHAYPNLSTFGLPCPTTIFTIGMLAMARGGKVRLALIVPILWSLVGGQAAFLLDVPPDLGLLAAGLIAVGLAMKKGRPPGRLRTPETDAWLRAQVNSDVWHTILLSLPSPVLQPPMPTHPKFTSHDDYIAAAHPQAQPILRQIGGIVDARVPQAVPCISYNMPAFKLGRTFFYFAAFKKHVGIYPPVTDDLQLISELAPFRNAKGNLAFPVDRDVPLDLIGRVATALASQYGTK